MKLSELIEEFIDLKIEGEPAYSEWQSIDWQARAREAYRERVEFLKAEIDAAVSGAAK